jgi:hypothetical protein
MQNPACRGVGVGVAKPLTQKVAHNGRLRKRGTNSEGLGQAAFATQPLKLGIPQHAAKRPLRADLVVGVADEVVQRYRPLARSLAV